MSEETELTASMPSWAKDQVRRIDAVLHRCWEEYPDGKMAHAWGERDVLEKYLNQRMKSKGVEPFDVGCYVEGFQRTFELILSEGQPVMGRLICLAKDWKSYIDLEEDQALPDELLLPLDDVPRLFNILNVGSSKLLLEPAEGPAIEIIGVEVDFPASAFTAGTAFQHFMRLADELEQVVRFIVDGDGFNTWRMMGGT